MSSCLDEFILYTSVKAAIRAIPAIPDPVSSQNSRNSHPSGFIQNKDTYPNPPESRHAYQFVLRGGEGGGVYICDTPDLEQARNDLLKRYGNRLLATTKV
jgi:hypothetical protein